MERTRQGSLRLRVEVGGRTINNNKELNSQQKSRAGHRTTHGANGANTLSRELIFFLLGKTDTQFSTKGGPIQEAHAAGLGVRAGATIVSKATASGASGGSTTRT